MENWKDIKGFEDYYQISDHGNLRSKDRLVKSKNNSMSLKKGREKRAGITNGYRVALLSRFGKEKGIGVHRLVAMHFIDNPYNKSEVNHKDGDKLNNHKDNLEWSTSSENSQHSFDNGLQLSRKGSNHHFSKISESDVIKMFELLNSGVSRKDITDMFNLSYSSICRILRKSTWKHINTLQNER